MYELTIKQKLTNYCYFVIFNSILACVIGVGYWFRGPVNFCMPIPKLTNWFDIIYIITTHFSVITLLTFLVSLVLLPSIYLSAKKALLVQSILTSLFIGLLIFDVGVFHADNMHLANIDINAVTAILFNKGIMLRANKIIAYIAFIVFIVLIYFTNNWVFKTNWLCNNKIGFRFASLLLASSVISLLTYQLTTKEKQQQLLVYVQYLPINNNNYEIISAYKQVKYGKVQYPVKPLQTTVVTNPPNILIIAMDAWRADCFNEIDSPNLWKFAKQGIMFNNHKAAGNGTKNSLFGLFYSIPTSYKNIFFHKKTSPLFIERLRQLDYQLNFFSSYFKDDICFYMENIFGEDAKIHREKGVLPSERDSRITDYILDWYSSKKDKYKPWLAFVLYDSLKGPDFPENYSTYARPAIELRDYKEFANKFGKQGLVNSYKTAVNYIDSLANKILIKLKECNDLDNTMIIITADHGCEWDDNNQGQWGYGSNVTNCQIQVPLAIILPKKFQQKLINQQDNLTTHYDVVPTIMKNFLGVTNDISDYSIGHDLLNKNIQEFCIVCCPGQYGTCDIAIIEINKVLKINNRGIVNYIDNYNHLIFNKAINTKHLNQALECMTRFIKK